MSLRKVLPSPLASHLVKSYSVTSAWLPDFVESTKAKLVDSLRPGGLIYEIKLDGFRALALCGGSETWILSRNKKDLFSKDVAPRSAQT